MSFLTEREIDALVAEKVFSWRKIPGPATDYDGPCEVYNVLVPPEINDPFPLYPARGAIMPWYFCRDWSTDIAAAWEVVEKMKFWQIKSTYKGIFVIFYDISNNYFYTIADTAPMAICLAALKAVGVEVDIDATQTKQG